jgi:Ca-activated chloride channel family protein
MRIALACICAALLAGTALAQRSNRPTERRPPREPKVVDEFKGPQHLAIVIDCSVQNKRSFEKSIRQATRVIERLTEKDTVSIVVFDDAAELLLPATPVTDKAAILAKLQGLKPRGMKALFAGVAKGAEEVRRNKSEEQAKRVLLLVGNGTGKQIGPGDENELETLKKSLSKENITLVQPPAGHGGGSRDGDQPRRRKGERGGGAKRVE